MKDISEKELQVFEHILKKLQRNADALVLAGPPLANRGTSFCN